MGEEEDSMSRHEQNHDDPVAGLKEWITDNTHDQPATQAVIAPPYGFENWDTYCRERVRSGSVQEFSQMMEQLYTADHVDMMIQFLPMISQRFGREMYKADSADDLAPYDAVADDFKMILWSIAAHPLNPNSPAGRSRMELLSREVAKIYHYATSENLYLRSHVVESMEYLAVIDDNNRHAGLSVDLRRRFVDDMVDKLIHPENDRDLETGWEMMQTAWRGGRLQKVLAPAVMAADSQEAAVRIYQYLGNKLSPAVCFKILKIESRHNPQLREKVNQFYRWLDLMPNDAETTDVQDLYDSKFDIAQWDPNDKSLVFETDYLLSNGKRDGRYLDMAAGAGRHILSLMSKGADVVGIDISMRNIMKIRDQNPHARVTTASWDHVPYKTESFDTVFCIGRSFQHNATIHDAVRALREGYRMLKPDGVMVIDSADSEQGYVGEMAGKFDALNARLGVTNSEPGMMVSSPTGRDFVERWVPGPDTYRKLALVAGFEVAEVTTKKYMDHHQKENTNYYYKLVKKNPPPSLEERVQALDEVRRSTAPLELLENP